MLTKYYLIITIIFIFGIIPEGYSQIKGTIWDSKDIYKVPNYKVLSKDSAIGIVYEGLNYKGHAKNVFAYYSSPGILTGNKSEDKKIPAVVLVHGGGGTAFKKWVLLWAKKGYFAIAMDLRGNDETKKHIEGGFDEPNGLTPYFTITEQLNEQWMYQAVADVILAHNLIRSFNGVDSNRTALTGISWGGIISSTLAGIDNRFKAVVPVYGCGYLFQNSAMKKELDKLDERSRDTWIKQYDPSNYLSKAKMPMLFINGTNDGNFFLDSYAKSYDLVRNKKLSVKIGLKHNHAYGWGNNEIYSFINSYLNHTVPLPSIDNIQTKKGHAIARVNSQLPIANVYINYTTDTLKSLKDRCWKQNEVTIKNNKWITTTVPASATIWYLSVVDKRGLQVSADLQWSVVQ
ncbi:MAG: alpha/beta fold hydrolase [Pedobacter sp.]|uniref:alpha/beta hydrolase family protein n=1 Tax=Pedobacter sp. TaxID=1411316 RepID=UPI0035614917